MRSPETTGEGLFSGGARICIVLRVTLPSDRYPSDVWNFKFMRKEIPRPPDSSSSYCQAQPLAFLEFLANALKFSLFLALQAMFSVLTDFLWFSVPRWYKHGNTYPAHRGNLKWTREPPGHSVPLYHAPHLSSERPGHPESISPKLLIFCQNLAPSVMRLEKYWYSSQVQPRSSNLWAFACIPETPRRGIVPQDPDARTLHGTTRF